MFARFTRFLMHAAGNVSATFAVMLAPLTASVGGALDYTRTFTIGAEVQTALDAGTLAAASISQTGDPETIVRNYINAALADHEGVLERLTVEVTSDIALNAREVTTEAVITVPTMILGVIGLDTLSLTRSSQATEEVRNLEIALVLDVSGSMSGSKITALREAAEEFVNVVMDPNLTDLTSVSVIPYNGGVRLPSVVTNALAPGTPGQSGCLEYGMDHPVSPDLEADSLTWLELEGRAQRGARASSFCPETDEAAVFLRRTRSELIGLIEDLDAGGNTGLDVATAWGARALDPAWRGRLGGDFANRPADYDDPQTMKALVVMTDGAATAQYRTYQDSNGNWRYYTIYNSARARSNMAAACDRAHGDGVQVYTIAFQVSGSTNRNLMRNCASHPDQYFEVENLDIAAAFSAIAADLNSLRLAR